MSIQGPNFHKRIDPVGDQPEDQSGKRGKGVRYQGRAWGRKEQDGLPAVTPQPPKQEKKEILMSLYADQARLDQAKKMFETLTTLEEKVAQLCFCQTEAVYDMTLQHEVELLIQAWQIGGVLFKSGEYRREGYLIEKFQELSKTPLLIGNDFLHGLSFYFQEEELPSFEGVFSDQRCGDLGKAVMVLNRKLRVHFQLDCERGSQRTPMTEEQARAFRKGIRRAHGIVARIQPSKAHYSESIKGAFPFPHIEEKGFSFGLEHPAQEFIGVKTLTLLDLTSEEVSEEKLIAALKGQYEIFLCGSNIQKVITSLANAVRYGKVKEAYVDRLVMKLLIIKAIFL